MDAQTGKCPNCGGVDIQALPGGSLRCSHCGSYFADSSRQAADKPSVHVHVHNVPQSGPIPAPQYAPQPQFAPPQPFVPQYAPPPPAVYYPPQRQGMNGCLLAFIIIFVLGIVGFVGLAFLGYAMEGGGSYPPVSPSSPGGSEAVPATGGKSFYDVQAAINANDIGLLRQLLDQDSSLVNSSGRAEFTSWDGYSTTLTGTTPLHVAAFNGNIEAVRLLISKSADLYATAYAEGGGYSATPLSLAQEMGQQEVVDELNAAMYGHKGG